MLVYIKCVHFRNGWPRPEERSFSSDWDQSRRFSSRICFLRSSFKRNRRKKQTESTNSRDWRRKGHKKGDSTHTNSISRNLHSDEFQEQWTSGCGVGGLFRRPRLWSSIPTMNLPHNSFAFAFSTLMRTGLLCWPHKHIQRRYIRHPRTRKGLCRMDCIADVLPPS